MAANPTRRRIRPCAVGRAAGGTDCQPTAFQPRAGWDRPLRGLAVKISTNLLIVGSISLLLSACGDAAKLPDQAGVGPNPTIPPPNPTLIPTVNIAAAKGW